MLYRAYKIGSDRAFLEMLHKLGGYDETRSDSKVEEEDATVRNTDTPVVRAFVEGVNGLVVGDPNPKDKHDTSKGNGPPINKKERWSSPVTISSGRW